MEKTALGRISTRHFRRPGGSSSPWTAWPKGVGAPSAVASAARAAKIGAVTTPTRLAACAFALAAPSLLFAASAPGDPDLVHALWPSSWISCAGAAPRGPGVYHFRKRITLGAAPARFVVHVSADNRFTLFVNGERVGDGPYRGDLDHWRYETFDLAPFLKAGGNTLAATVWNAGALAPIAQMSDQTGFLVQGDTAAESAANTDASWEAEPEAGESFLPIVFADVPGYYAAGSGERLDASRFDWDWQTSARAWPAAVPACSGEPGHRPRPSPVGAGSGDNRWLLVADKLPQMTYGDAPAGTIVRAQGIEKPAGFPVTVPARTEATILIDGSVMTTGYPEIGWSGGRGATVRLAYAEALVDAAGKKGNRSEIAGRRLVGLRDALELDGGAGRRWSPLWWRAWRFLEVMVSTGAEPVTIDSLRVHPSGFPFQERGSFEASDPQLAQIYRVGTRTARMNAHETYMDCPYWEQLQYIGDTRIQALISYTDFGDDRLARQALQAYDDSRTDEGLTQSRYPSALKQMIPTFSLYWIGMLRDYWMYRPDDGSLAAWVPHTRTVLAWYGRHVRPDGLLGRMPWWNYGDWTKDYDFGVPPQDPDGGSALLTLVYSGALRDGADLEDYLGNGAIARDYRARAEAASKAVGRLCWDESRGLLADTPAKRHFSEEANAMGVLVDAVAKDRQAEVLHRVLAHQPSLPVPAGEFSPASVYFRFYVARAMDHAGLADEYVGTLGPWRDMLALGLTTFAETADPARSDDHAWSAHPDYDLLTLVAGIRPASPGFRTVRVAPHPGPLASFEASMPHPDGDIRVRGRKAADGWAFDVALPPGLAGTFEWGGKATPIGAGDSHIGPMR